MDLKFDLPEEYSMRQGEIVRKVGKINQFLPIKVSCVLKGSEDEENIGDLTRSRLHG